MEEKRPKKRAVERERALSGGVRDDSFLSSRQKDGKPFEAEEIFRNTLDWLEEQGCRGAVPLDLIEKYAVCTARWKQCERSTSDLGMIAKNHQATGILASPYVQIGIGYLEESGKLWMEINKIVQAAKDDRLYDDPAKLEEYIFGF